MSDQRPDWVEPRYKNECRKCGAPMTREAAVEVCRRFFPWLAESEIPTDWIACGKCGGVDDC